MSCSLIIIAIVIGIFVIQFIILFNLINRITEKLKVTLNGDIALLRNQLSNLKNILDNDILELKKEKKQLFRETNYQFNQELKNEYKKDKKKKVKGKQYSADKPKEFLGNIEKVKPLNINYVYLGVSDGQLIESNFLSSYYRAWEYEGKTYYEFYCDESKMAKSINNRSVLIDPFCIKDESSIETAKAKRVETTVPGIIDISKKTILKQTIIKYI